MIRKRTGTYGARFARVLRDRRTFLALMGVGVLFKILVSMIVPISFDLRDMFLMATGQIQISGPWIIMESQMLSVWQSLTHTTSIPFAWWNKPPSSMPATLQLLSLLLRLPALAADLAMASVLYLIVKRTTSAELARFASLLWFLNPYTFFAVEILGVPDVAAILMVGLATLLMLYKRTAVSAIAFAGGVALKLFPLFLLPAFLILPSGVRDKGWRYAVLWIFISLSGFLAYYEWALIGGVGAPVGYSPIAQPLNAFFTALPATRISIALAAMVVLCFCMFQFAKSRELIISDLVLPILLVYFTLSDPYPQYFVWALPFMILDITQVKRRHLALLAVLIAVLFGNWFFFSQGFLAPDGYSFLLFPLQGQGLPWYAVAVQSLGGSSNPAYLVLNAALYATTFIYALEIMRGWSPSTSREKRTADSAPA